MATLTYALALQLAQRRETVLDVLEGREHRAAVVGDLLVVGSVRRGGLCRVQAAVEERHHRPRAHGPEAARSADPVGSRSAFQSRRAEQTEYGKVGRAGHTDGGVGGRHTALGRRDVRPALQELRGQAGRDLRNRQIAAGGARGDTEIGRLAADQHGDGMLGLSTAQTGILGLGAGRLQLRLRLLYVGDGRGPAVIQVLRELKRARVVGDRVIEQLLLDIQAA